MKYAIGIDLGTTNTEMAYCRLDGEGGSTTFDVPQFVAPSVIESRFRLPSFLYIGSEEERVSSSWKLPWDEDDDFDPVSSKSSPARDEKSGKKGFLERAFGLGTIFKKKLPEGLSNPNALYLVGEIASSRIVTEPERTVASAKSWLTATRVDRRSPILPWNSPDGCDKVSPVEASRRYLSHLVAAWNNSYPDAPIPSNSLC